jgi:hypothetical protein
LKKRGSEFIITIEVVNVRWNGGRMNYIEKLFKQHPFIYKIDGKYYAFGNNVCSECDYRSASLETKYNTYVQNSDKELESLEAWKIFHGVMFEAQIIRDKNMTYDCLEEFARIGLNEQNIKELEQQIDRYIYFFRRNNLVQYVK